MTRSFPLALVCAVAMTAGASAVGCAEPVVGVRLRFPSETTFLVTNTITVDVYDGEGTGEQSPDAICRALSVTTSVAPVGVQALESSGNTPACSLLAGGVSFENVDVGRRVFFAEATDSEGAAILRGCSVADVFGDAADKATLAPEDAETADALGASALVDVQLATLPTYPEDQVPLCEDVTAKCTENTKCF